MEGATLHTGATLDALLVIDDVRFFARNTTNGSNGAIAGALRALLALSRINPISDKALTNMGGARLIDDVGLIFFGEFIHGRKNRVSRGLTKRA